MPGKKKTQKSIFSQLIFFEGRDGILEYWNIGGKGYKPIVPSFQPSNIPIF
jgi:hypothetical protein